MADLARPMTESLRLAETAMPSILAAQKIADAFASSARLAGFSRATAKMADLARPMTESLRLAETAMPSILAESKEPNAARSPDMEAFEAVEFSLADTVLVLYVNLVLVLMLLWSSPPGRSWLQEHSSLLSALVAITSLYRYLRD